MITCAPQKLDRVRIVCKLIRQLIVGQMKIICSCHEILIKIFFIFLITFLITFSLSFHVSTCAPPEDLNNLGSQDYFYFAIKRI